MDDRNVFDSMNEAMKPRPIQVDEEDKSLKPLKLRRQKHSKEKEIARRKRQISQGLLSPDGREFNGKFQRGVFEPFAFGQD